MSKMQKKLTPWFSIDIKPARLGVYQFDDDIIVYRRWFGDGFGAASPTPERAAQATRVTWEWSDRHLAGSRWRGLASDPATQTGGGHAE